MGYIRKTIKSISLLIVMNAWYQNSFAQEFKIIPIAGYTLQETMHTGHGSQLYVNLL